MNLSDEQINEIVKEFFQDVKIARPRYWNKHHDEELIEKSNAAMKKILSKY